MKLASEPTRVVVVGNDGVALEDRAGNREMICSTESAENSYYIADSISGEKKIPIGYAASLTGEFRVSHHSRF